MSARAVVDLAELAGLGFEYMLRQPVAVSRARRADDHTHAIAITEAVKNAGDEIKERLRDDVRRARMGARLPTTWRGDFYPNRNISETPAYWIYSIAPHIISGHSGEPVTIGGRKVYAVPIKGSPAENIKEPPGPRTKVDEAEARWGKLDLIPVRGRRARAMLVARDVRITTRKAGRKGRLVRKARLKSGDYGAGAATVPLFWIVSGIHRVKRLRPREIMREAQAEWPRLVEGHYRAALPAARRKARAEAMGGR